MTYEELEAKLDDYISQLAASFGRTPEQEQKRIYKEAMAFVDQANFPEDLFLKFISCGYGEGLVMAYGDPADW